jgi:protein-serine/threonine kinase
MMQQDGRNSPSVSASQRKKPTQPQQFHRRSIGDWDFIKTVGAGSMGKVKLAKHRRTNEVCAIKIVPRASKLYERAHVNDPPPNSSQERLVRLKEYNKEFERDRRTIREASLGRILYHPFICRLFEVKTMSNHYYMLFEYVSAGQMLDYIVSHGSLKERHARKFARGVSSALDYLHKNNVVHRDLKIENIMISKTGDIKIIDFGLSNMYSNDSLLKTYCGSLYFAAPELLSAHPYIGPEIDIWSFGVVLYVLVCGKVPFDDQSVSVLHEKIKKGKVDYPPFLSPEVVSLLSRMLVVNPNKRAHLSEVLSHPWMTKGFEGPPASFVPHRVPLSLPLDPEVVEEIVRLEFGTSEEQVSDDLTRIIISKYYQDATHNWKLNTSRPELQERMSVSPTMGFHPLVSIYYLVDEMLKRKKTRQSIVDIPLAVPQEEQQLKKFSTPQLTQQSTFAERIPVELSTPTPQPQLTFPEAAHTTPTHVISPVALPDAHVTHPDANDHEDLLQQQQMKKNEEGKGLNSILRKFSQRRAHSMRRPQGHAHSNSISANETPSQQVKMAGGDKESMRRVGSLRVAKTHLADDYDNDKPSKTTKSHTRTVSAYAGPPSSVIGDVPPLPTNISTNEKKFHPTARAKSLGHAQREFSNFGNPRHAPAPPLPTDLDDGFFDDITLDEFNDNGATADKVSPPSQNSQPITTLRSELSEGQIMEQAAKAQPGSMPSIEHPRSLFLKGFFSVQTTSTKPLPVIRADIISVLSKLGVQFTEVRGGFVCVHTPSIGGPVNEVNNAPTITVTGSDDKKEEENGEGGSLASQKSSGGESGDHRKGLELKNTADSNYVPDSDQLSTPSSSLKSHRRKFSIGGSILGYRRKPSIGPPAIPPTPVATNYQNTNSPTTHIQGHNEFDSSASLDSLNAAGHGGSDMLISSRIEQTRVKAASPVNASSTEGDGGHPQAVQPLSVAQSRTPLKFEIHIVKVPLVGLFGVHFKKVTGNTWMYKALAGQILNELNL